MDGNRVRGRIGRHGTDVDALNAVQKAVQRIVRTKYPGWSQQDREDLESVVLERYVHYFGRGPYTVDEEDFDAVPATHRAWLHTVIRNAGTDMFRMQRARPADAFDFNGDDNAAVEARLQGALSRPRLSAVVANRVDLARALGALGAAYPNDVDLIRLHVVEDRTVADVAEVIGKTEAATRKAIQRALERLRGFLPQTDEAHRAATRRVARRS